MTDAPEWLGLDRDETVVWTGRPRTRRILGTAAGALLTSLVVVAVLALLATGVAGDAPGGDAMLAAYAIGALVILGSVGQVVVAYARVQNTDYVLTTDNVYRKTGILSETVTRVGVDKVQNVRFTQDFFGKTFDYGTIEISTAGSEGAELAVADLDDPGEFRRALNERIRRADPSGVASAGPGERRGPTGPDSEALRTAVEETRRLRETTERIEAGLVGDRSGTGDRRRVGGEGGD